MTTAFWLVTRRNSNRPSSSLIMAFTVRDSASFSVIAPNTKARTRSLSRARPSIHSRSGK